MIFEYKKYKDINDFVFNRPKSKNNEKYTILQKCKGLEKDYINYNDNCFGCLFCAISNQKQLELLKKARGEEFITKVAKESFKGIPIEAPKTLRGLKHPYMSLEKFTEVNETTNIQPWAAGLLEKMSFKESRVSMEIPVFNNDYDRNGRLDIGIIADDEFLAIESKTSLDDALKDERFVEQHIKYTIEIEKSTKNYIYLTLFGGKETDLFPENNTYCTGKIGDKTKRFYKILSENNIQFITANALWCLCCKYIEYGTKYSWDNIIKDIFKNQDCIGLLSAGIVKKSEKDYVIEPLA